MPSKREGRIQPSVTSQPPRFAALTRGRGEAGFGSGTNWAREDGHEKHRRMRRHTQELLIVWALVV
jgi:hypothetical protein